MFAGLARGGHSGGTQPGKASVDVLESIMVPGKFRGCNLLGYEELQIADSLDSGGGRHLSDLFDVAISDLATSDDRNFQSHGSTCSGEVQVATWPVATRRSTLPKI